MSAEKAVGGHGVEQFVEPALAALTNMVLPSGLVCYELLEGDPEPRGVSVRYTLIVALGLLRAEQRGVAAPLAPGELIGAVDAALDRREVTPGDVALRLWAQARVDRSAAGTLTDRLDESLRSHGGVGAREGLELAWIVTGLAAASDHGRARGLLTAAIDQLIAGNQTESGLFRHFGARGARRRFPNFATQIYSVLALAVVAQQGLDERALPAARAAADRLLELQLEDGGWPWLFDAERGTIVERYEVYSVHQHGMAPMALHELSAISGDERYAAAAARGLAWLFGANELAEDMVPLERGMTYRSIRRVRPLDRLWLYAHTAAAVAGRPRGRRGRMLEVNRSCRPYELGWLVEAWAGVNCHPRRS